MTSHKDMLGKHSADELDGLIRRALRERALGAVPSPHVWERVARRVERGSVLRRSRWGLVPFLRWMVVWLSVDTSLPRAAQRLQRGEIAVWGDNLSRAWALDPHHILLRSVA
jgi:hypothetical protein